jgi:hypothetical protein
MESTENLFNQANQAQQDVMSGMQQASKLPDMLRQAVSERFKDSPMYGLREQAATNMLNYGPDTRAEMAQLGQSGQAILSPTQQQAIYNQGRTATSVPLMTLNDLLQMRTGTTEQAINTGLQAYQSDLQAKNQLAQTLYQQAQDAWQRDMAEREFALKQSSASGGGLTQLLSGLSMQKPTEAKPMYSPTKGVGSLSKAGEWTFDGIDWVPAQKSGGLESLITPDLLMAGVISGDISSTEANTLAKLSGLATTSAEKNRQTMLDEKEYNINRIQKAIDLLSGGDVKTGPLSGNIISAKSKVMKLEPSEQDIYNLINDIQMKKLFEIGGKVLPAQEMARIEPIVPSMTRPTEYNISKLEELKRELEAIYGRTIDTQSGSDWELVQ